MHAMGYMRGIPPISRRGRKRQARADGVVLNFCLLFSISKIIRLGAMACTAREVAARKST